METSALTAAQEVVQTILGCGVTLVTDPAAFAVEFQSAHCFHPGLQPAFTAGNLADTLQRLDTGVVIELSEALGIAVVLFRTGDDVVVIGPYTERPIRPGDAESLLGSLQIPAGHLQAYKLYRSQYPIVEFEFARRGAQALLEADGMDVAATEIRRITADVGPVGPGEPPHSESFEVINERYAAEQEFMQAVAEGHESRALATLSRLARQPANSSYLMQPFLGATIIRIMCRIGAQQGGLPPVSIDAISQTYAQRLHRSGHTTDPTASMSSIGSMVREFCRAVQRHHRRPYSQLVRQVMDEVELHLSHNVSPRQIATRLHISESHLARRFKAETGRTITEHVAHERMRRAAQLLRGSTQPVREIAAYVGYPDANYFVKVFKAAFGLTPTAYRRQEEMKG